MTTKDFNNKKPVLTFEGKKYIMENFSDEIKDLIKSLQIADAQLKMHEDTLKLISIGKNSLINDLRKKLEDI
tara:strand:+ start:510 stop:725 length:216 start_codon:yes stop_codon:yes gene_type:complete